MSLDAEEQDDELLALSSIYEESFTPSQSQEEGVDGGSEERVEVKGGELAISLDLLHIFVLTYKHTNQNGEVETQSHMVEHLPSIYLHFTFPPTYPSHHPPSFTLSCKWLNRAQLTVLCQQLDSLWRENEGSVVMFTWVQFLKDESLSQLGVTDHLDLEASRPVRPAGNNASGLVVGGNASCDSSGLGGEASEYSSGANSSVDNSCDISVSSGSDSGGASRNSNGDVGGASRGSTGNSEGADTSRNGASDLEGASRNSISNSDIGGAARSNNSGIRGATRSSNSESGGASNITISRQNSLSHYDIRAIQDISPKTNMLRLLRDYDEEMRRQVFCNKMFECKVCLMDKLGSNCLEFWPCRHVYCKECMASYFSVQISEGNIMLLRCPEDQCESEAHPLQVQELVPEELYRRWDEMLLNSTLSSLGDIQPCPRIHCQYPCTVEDGQGQCPSCKFVFCGVCRFSWHGVDPCRLKNSEVKKIMEVYINGREDEKRRLEELYGKKYLMLLRDEHLSFSYLEENSKKCPKCMANIEKIDGCNKMTCQRCSIYFCWLCMMILNRGHPYAHYNDRNSPCFNQLFMGMDEDEDDFWDDSDDEMGMFLD